MLRRRAARWLARLQGGPNPGIEREFQKWRDADPRHSAAFDRVRRSYEQAGLLRHSPIVASGRHDPVIRKAEWRARPALAAAAAIALLVPIGAVLLRGGVPMFGGSDALILMTSVGEIRQVGLADGSSVTLDTATSVEVEIGRSRRTAHLKHGRARFHVTPAAEPFVIDTASTTIASREGVIDVEQVARTSRVSIISGTAEVRGSGQVSTAGLALAAGEGVTVERAGPEQKHAVPAAADWTRGMLQFDRTPLGEAVALANRYSDRRIILGTDLAALRVTGAFRAGDSASFAKALASAFGLSIGQDAEGNLILSRRRPAARQNKNGG